MNRDDIIFYSICVFFLLGNIGVVVFETNSLPWTISVFVAVFGYMGMFGALAVKLLVRVIKIVKEEGV